MCGRYTLSTPAGRLAEEFQLDSTSEIVPSYNVAPTQQVAAVLEDEGGRRLEMLRWGLVPSWADDPDIGARMINARQDLREGRLQGDRPPSQVPHDGRQTLGRHLHGLPEHRVRKSRSAPDLRSR